MPIPWFGSKPPYGFTHNGVTPWLEQPDDWSRLTVEAQDADPASMLSLYRAGLRLRRAAPWGDDDDLRWLPSPEDVLAFGRGERFVCLVNFGHDPYPLPPGADVLIASGDLEGGAVPPETTVWFQTAVKAPTGQGKEGR